MLSTRATELTAQITAALDALDAADADTAHDIDEAFGFSGAPAETRPASAVGDIVSGWPTMGQDRIAAQIATMTPEQRQHLITDDAAARSATPTACPGGCASRPTGSTSPMRS